MYFTYQITFNTKYQITLEIKRINIMSLKPSGINGFAAMFFFAFFQLS